MTSRFSYKATALALAAMITVIVLAGLDGLAANEAASARIQVAQATATLPG